MEGDESAQFLQGLITNDINSVAEKVDKFVDLILYIPSLLPTFLIFGQMLTNYIKLSFFVCMRT